MEPKKSSQNTFFFFFYALQITVSVSSQKEKVYLSLVYWPGLSQIFLNLKKYNGKEMCSPQDLSNREHQRPLRVRPNLNNSTFLEKKWGE